MPKIRLPHNFTPRPYQLPALRALDEGKTRIVAVWHRRAGKEKTFLNHTIKTAFSRVGTYYYMFPTYTQAKRAIWDGRDRAGFPFLGHFPAELTAAKNETELKVTLINQSIVQFVGADSYNSLMSTNPVGCVFAEYALQDPRAWDYFRPILRENGGWAIFDFTPRGRNHGYQLYDMAMKLQAAGDPAWFCQRLTVHDTKVLTEADLEAERREGMDEEMIQQEYFCSFEGAQHGSYFGREMAAAETEGRITRVPYEAQLPVHTWWDIGIDDAMAIWFTQDVGREIHVIDYYENSGEGLPHYARVLQDRGYVYGSHTAPHDIEVREVGTGKSRIETAAALGIRYRIAPNISKQDGIDAARMFIPRCWFDREKTERGRLALVSYHKKWDEKRRCFLAEPYHDWASNASDAFRYLAVGHRTAKLKPERTNVFPRPQPMPSAGATSWMGV